MVIAVNFPLAIGKKKPEKIRASTEFEPVTSAILVRWLVEHRTGIAEVTGSNPVEALIFSGFFFPIA